MYVILFLRNVTTYVTVFWKSYQLDTRTEIDLLPVLDRHTHALYIQKHQALDSRLPGLLLQTAFYRCCETTRVHFMVLGHINRTAWGTKLLRTAVLWIVSVHVTY